jgi:IS4 transposase
VGRTSPAHRAGGRTKTTAIRVLTALLDPDRYPAGELAALYAKRWQMPAFRRCESGMVSGFMV